MIANNSWPINTYAMYAGHKHPRLIASYGHHFSGSPYPHVWSYETQPRKHKGTGARIRFGRSPPTSGAPTDAPAYAKVVVRDKTTKKPQLNSKEEASSWGTRTPSSPPPSESSSFPRTHWSPLLLHRAPSIGSGLRPHERVRGLGARKTYLLVCLLVCLLSCKRQRMSTDSAKPSQRNGDIRRRKGCAEAK